MNVFLSLFIEFFKTGVMAVGGGLVVLPFLYDIAAKYGWFSEAMLADMIAVSESTPGPIGINMATYAGYSAAGILGSCVATLSIAIGPFIIACIVAVFMERFRKSRLVDNIFSGLRPVVCGLIAYAAWAVFRIAVLNADAIALGNWSAAVNWKAAALFAVMLFAAGKYKKIHPAVFIAVAAVIGIIFGF